MSNPVLVEVTRGRVVESQHRGSIAIVDGDGRLVASCGDIGRPVFPRSSIKAFQALPLIETGAADKFGLTVSEIALAMASHNGEARHVAGARSMLAKAGLNETCLACGPQWPERGVDQAVLHRMQAGASRIHNNCSGKHAGFLCAAVAMGVDPAGYEQPDHPLMREVVAAMAAMTGAAHAADICGTDGCSIPTYAIPLQALAHGFARFATGNGLSPSRARAAERLRAAAATDPFMIAGTHGVDSEVMAILKDRAFIKFGAEAVYTAALPELGLGIALKIDDGAKRAAEVVVVNLLIALLKLDANQVTGTRLGAMARPAITSRKGEVCGELRYVPPAMT